MKKIDLGQTIQILANVGVIAGIVFLAIELRQAQLVGRSQVRNEITLGYLELYLNDMHMDDRTLALTAGGVDEPLSDADQTRLNIWGNAWFRIWENAFYQYRQGLFDEEEFRAASAGLRGRVNTTPRLRDRFCRGRENLSAGFVGYVDSLLDVPCN